MQRPQKNIKKMLPDQKRSSNVYNKTMVDSTFEISHEGYDQETTTDDE